MIANILSYCMKIDTSVWNSSVIKKESKSREIFRLVLQGKLFAQMSGALLNEYESVIRRKKIIALVPITPQKQLKLLDAFCSVAEFNTIYYAWRPNLKDEGDNFLIELAVSSDAEVILTYNEKDFQGSELVFNFRVMTPENFLKEYKI